MKSIVAWFRRLTWGKAIVITVIIVIAGNLGKAAINKHYSEMNYGGIGGGDKINNLEDFLETTLPSQQGEYTVYIQKTK